MDAKKISIVLPVYNGAKYLAESIESIIAQTYTNWELIVVNDCSSDNSLNIATEYASKDARIKVFTNPQNLKLPNSLNEGFKHASGEYYTWTSDDNKYKPNALRIMTEHLENDPDTKMVYANYTRIDSNGDEIEPIKLLDVKHIFAGNVIGACFLYTADAAQRVGEYDANLFLAEDYDYWIRLYEVGNVLHIEDDLYYYRIHDMSLTETRKNLVAEQVYKVLKKNFLFVYTKSIENNLYSELFDFVLDMASTNYEETLKKLLLMKPQYRYHIYWRKFKVFIWYSRLWQKWLKLKKAL